MFIIFLAVHTLDPRVHVRLRTFGGDRGHVVLLRPPVMEGSAELPRGGWIVPQDVLQSVPRVVPQMIHGLFREMLFRALFHNSRRFGFRENHPPTG